MVKGARLPGPDTGTATPSGLSAVDRRVDGCAPHRASRSGIRGHITHKNVRSATSTRVSSHLGGGGRKATKAARMRERYERFGRGEVEAALDLWADDFAWEGDVAGLPDHE